MIAGIWVLNFFATAWGTLGVSHAHLPRWWLVVPPAVSLMLVAVCTRMAGRTAPLLDARHVRRVVGLWSAVEGIAIIVAVALLKHFGWPDLTVPVIAIIVGLHFFPLAWFMPLSLYRGTGAAMVAVGVAGILLPLRLAVPVTGSGSAMILWATSLALGFVRRKGSPARRTGRGGSADQDDIRSIRFD